MTIAQPLSASSSGSADYGAAAAAPAQNTPPPLAPQQPMQVMQGYPVQQYPSVQQYVGTGYQPVGDGPKETAAPAAVATDSGLQVNTTMYDTWRVPLMPETKEIKQLLKTTILMPCTAAAQQQEIARLETGDRVLPAGLTGVLPLLALDLIPLVCCGIPFPAGSWIATVDNRRTIRHRYRIHGSLIQDQLNSLCLPCAMVQIQKEMQVRGDVPQTCTME